MTEQGETKSNSNSKESQLRICCIANDVRSGGAGKSLLVLISRLSRHFHVSLLARSESVPDQYRNLSINYHRIRSGFLPLCYLSGARPPFLINYLAWLARCAFLPETLKRLYSEKPDVVLINGFQGVWYLPFLPRKTKKVLYARELLDMSKFLSRLVVQVINQHADQVICITANEKRNLPELKCPVSVVYNSYENEWREQGQSAEVAPHPGKDIRVGVFGTIHQAKGQYLVVELADKYQDTLRQLGVRFYIYGNKSTLTTREGGVEQLAEEVINKNLSDMVLFPGWVDDVSGTMNSIDIVLRPDTSGCPWGRDVIEAMSNGKPVIAAGSSEVFIKQGVTGMLFTPMNMDDMAKKLLILCNDKGQRDMLGQNARQFARENFDPALNGDKVAAIIEKLAGT